MLAPRYPPQPAGQHTLLCVQTSRAPCTSWSLQTMLDQLHWPLQSALSPKSDLPTSTLASSSPHLVQLVQVEVDLQCTAHVCLAQGLKALKQGSLQPATTLCIKQQSRHAAIHAATRLEASWLSMETTADRSPAVTVTLGAAQEAC